LGRSAVVRLMSELSGSAIDGYENAYLHNRSGSLGRAQGIRGEVKRFPVCRVWVAGRILPAGCERRVLA
jgi:hypothetical protein